MTNILVVVAFFFFFILFIIGSLWVLVPAMYGLPSRPTYPDRIRAALKLANLKADELLYDLGAGDGRVLVIAPWRCYRISGIRSLIPILCLAG